MGPAWLGTVPWLLKELQQHMQWQRWSWFWKTLKRVLSIPLDEVAFRAQIDLLLAIEEARKDLDSLDPVRGSVVLWAMPLLVSEVFESGLPAGHILARLSPGERERA